MRRAYKTRRHQIDALLRELINECKPFDIPPAVKRKIRRQMQRCALIGVAEERTRILGILASALGDPREIIVSQSIEEVLGIELKR